MTVSNIPAALAFDAIAPDFDTRFGSWLSVAAQRRAVRSELLRAFPAGGKILELGGGTGEDAAFLARQGFRLLHTDPSPAMVSRARLKLAPFQCQAEVCAAEDLENFAMPGEFANDAPFEGAFSNFAALNCVGDISPVARGLARYLKPGAAAMLVLFGTCCAGEVVTEFLRLRPHFAFRRFKRGAVAARLSGREFQVTYHRRRSLQSTFAPWFVLEKQFGIGITVPPSAAEPWMSAHPRLLAAMEALDSTLRRPLAILGDHVLFQFRRTTERCDAPGGRTIE